MLPRMLHGREETMKTKLKIFKCEAQGDTVYIEAPNLDRAKVRLEQVMGKIPESLLKWSEVQKLPKGETFL